MGTFMDVVENWMLGRVGDTTGEAAAAVQLDFDHVASGHTSAFGHGVNQCLIKVENEGLAGDGRGRREYGRNTFGAEGIIGGSAAWDQGPRRVGGARVACQAERGCWRGRGLEGCGCQRPCGGGGGYR